jgi:hypothetical protein
MRQFLIFILFFFTCFHFGTAQDIPIGDWRDHLPYSDAVSVSFGDNKVYCATNSAVFIYDMEDQSIERLNLVNGLSDIGLSKIKYNNYNQKVIITYANGNVDVIESDKSITNLSFIKNSGIVGSKTINHIYLVGKLAYLSTGFGIVVMDTDKLEIVDTYLFGPLGSFMFTNAVTMDSLYIYAATDQGIYYADKTNPNLIDYNVWSFLPDLGTLNYSNIVTFSGRVFTTSESSTFNGDSIFYNDGGNWQKFLPNGYNINNLDIGSYYMFITYHSWVEKYNQSLVNLQTVSNYQGQFNLVPNQTTYDDEDYMLIAENSHGIIRAKNNNDSEIILPNGPSSSNTFEMDLVKDELWVASGGYNQSDFTPSSTTKNLYNHKSKGTWEAFDEITNNIDNNPARDAVSVAINPSNSDQVFIGTWDDGLFEIVNGNVANIYTAQNSALDSTFFGSTKVGALEFDSDNNLWTLNAFTNNPLTVKSGSNWYSYGFPTYISSGNRLTKLLIDQNNYKWMVEPKVASVLVFDDNGTLSEQGDDRVVLNHNITGSRIYSIVEDLDGEIWIGTDEGVSVFYNPSAVFDENITAEQIFIQQDGQTQILLETEIVSAIAIDGANRKWIGTQSSGVFLMSEDGTEQIEHFTSENSPLFSDNIFDIVIDPKTGEVYFGTEKGLISYKGTATEAADDFSNVFVYPNPVKPDFEGTIAIRGLVSDTDVRITDISGNIVYQTTSLGGQAIWDGKDFNGNRVQTGVYMVFNGSPEGELKAAAKILFIH